MTFLRELSYFLVGMMLLGAGCSDETTKDSPSPIHDMGKKDIGGLIEDKGINVDQKKVDDQGLADDMIIPSTDSAPSFACNNSKDRYEAMNCIRDNYLCNALNICETGYECKNQECACKDIATCGISCTSSAGCPTGLDCDVDTKRCREKLPPTPCFTNMHCPAGLVCAFEEGVCLPKGTKKVGEACLTNDECEDRVCHTKVCLQRCLKNSECPQKQWCVFATGTFARTLVCLPQSSDPKCTDPKEANFYSQKAICHSSDNICNKKSDCTDPKQDCVYPHPKHIGEFDYPQCYQMSSGSSPYCQNDDEMIPPAISHQSICTSFKPCWSAANCPANYKCDKIQMKHPVANQVETRICYKQIF